MQHLPSFLVTLALCCSALAASCAPVADAELGENRAALRAEGTLPEDDGLSYHVNDCPELDDMQDSAALGPAGCAFCHVPPTSTIDRRQKQALTAQPGGSLGCSTCHGQEGTIPKN